MRVYEDKETGKWKTATNGQAIYDSKQAAEKAQLNSVIEKLWDLQQKRNQVTNR